MKKLIKKEKSSWKKDVEKTRIAIIKGIDDTDPKSLSVISCGIIEALLTIYEAFDGVEKLTKEGMINSFCELLIKRGLLGLEND